MAAALFEVRAHAFGKGLFALRPIPAGAALFGEDEWVDDAERGSFVTLTTAQFDALPPEQRTVFARFAYNTGTDAITGTFRPEGVRHPTNFANHCCDPNAGYDGTDAIIALRAIAAGEEIRMDYGTFSFSFDHAFVCRCGAPSCRGKVTGGDWPMLVRSGLRLPAFMQKQADSVA
jgi:SET domain-containing protein